MNLKIFKNTLALIKLLLIFKHALYKLHSAQYSKRWGGNVGRALALEIEKIGDYSEFINPTTVLAGRCFTNTTKRDPSGFEYVQKKAKKLKLKVCRSLYRLGNLYAN
jgi:hypothetical protein